MPYAQTTLGQAVIALAARLEDPNNVFWSQTELYLALQEALRVWNAYTSWYRFPVVLEPITPPPIASSAGANWYDLSALAGFTYTVEAGDIIQQILFNLLEDPVPTQQFPSADIFNAVQRRLRKFRADSGIVIDYQQQAISSQPDGRSPLTGTLIDIRRVAYIDPVTAAVTNLWRANEWEFDSFAYGWWNGGYPQAYSTAVTPPLSIAVVPAPSPAGTLEILAVTAGPDIATDQTTKVQIPDDYTWAIKWGAMADLLSHDGEGKDIARAQYCEQRYREAVELARSFPSILNARGDGLVTIWVGSVFEMDAFATGWQNVGMGCIGTGGRNLIAVSGPQGISFDLVGNIPIPVNFLTDYMGVPADVFSAILDYAQHLASFKMGGDEFFATEQQRSSLVLMASQYNSRLRQLNFFNESMRAPASKNLGPVPRIELADNTAPNYGAGIRKAGGSPVTQVQQNG